MWKVLHWLPWRNTKEKPFENMSYVRVFSASNYIQILERHHTGVDTYVSIQFGNGFTSHHDDQIYESVHTEENSSACKYSGKFLTNHSSSCKYERAEMGGELYTWKQCGKTFSTKVVINIWNN